MDTYGICLELSSDDPNVVEALRSKIEVVVIALLQEDPAFEHVAKVTAVNSYRFHLADVDYLRL